MFLLQFSLVCLSRNPPGAFLKMRPPSRVKPAARQKLQLSPMLKSIPFLYLLNTISSLLSLPLRVS